MSTRVTFNIVHPVIESLYAKRALVYNCTLLKKKKNDKKIKRLLCSIKYNKVKSMSKSIAISFNILSLLENYYLTQLIQF